MEMLSSKHTSPRFLPFFSLSTHYQEMHLIVAQHSTAQRTYTDSFVLFDLAVAGPARPLPVAKERTAGVPACPQGHGIPDLPRVRSRRRRTNCCRSEAAVAANNRLSCSSGVVVVSPTTHSRREGGMKVVVAVPHQCDSCGSKKQPQQNTFRVCSICSTARAHTNKHAHVHRHTRTQVLQDCTHCNTHGAA